MVNDTVECVQRMPVPMEEFGYGRADQLLTLGNRYRITRVDQAGNVSVNFAHMYTFNWRNFRRVE